jgi:hypothetical protein
MVLGDFMQKWCRSENYIGESYNDYYVLLSRNRDSGLVEESNFQSALKALNGESDTVKVIRSSHWLCGWIEMILIHESDVKSVDKGNEIEKALDNYPILDEDIFGELVTEKETEMYEQIKYDVEHGLYGFWDLPKDYTDEDIWKKAERFISDEW